MYNRPTYHYNYDQRGRSDVHQCNHHQHIEDGNEYHDH
jgi:hypothetical protein